MIAVTDASVYWIVGVTAGFVVGWALAILLRSFLDR